MTCNTEANMQLITLQIHIAAPPERCFLLSLNIDLHKESTAQTSARAIAGVSHGLKTVAKSPEFLPASAT
jgi:hypothetical protein